jgi:hypothetical protein
MWGIGLALLDAERLLVSKNFLVILHLISLSVGTHVWADEPCQSVAEGELVRLGLGTFDHPEAGTSKDRRGITVLGTDRKIIGNMTTFVANRPVPGSPLASRMVEYFKFGSKSESDEFPFMLLSGEAQARYLDHRSSILDHDPVLIYVSSRDKYEHTGLGSILLVVNKDCHVVKAKLDPAGLEANPESCKTAPPGHEWRNGILNTLCDRYFQWTKEVKAPGQSPEARADRNIGSIPASTAR